VDIFMLSQVFRIYSQGKPNSQVKKGHRKLSRRVSDSDLMS